MDQESADRFMAMVKPMLAFLTVTVGSLGLISGIAIGWVLWGQ